MKELFTYLFDFSIVTSIAILLAILLRPILKKGPSFVRCILWTLVFLRLLVPVGLLEFPFSAPNLFTDTEETVSTPQGETKPAESNVADDNNLWNSGQTSAENPAVQNPSVQEPNVQPPAVQEPDVQAPDVQPPVVQEPGVQTPTVQEPNAQIPDAQEPAKDTISGHGGIAAAPVTDQTVSKPGKETDVLLAVSVVWAVGVIAMLGYMLVSNLLLRYRVRDAIVYDSKTRVINRDCSPFVFGIFRPTIYIPASANKQDWPHIIAHETSHIKRFDHVLKPLAFFVLCFYWFNPLVWVAYILLGKDIEYACDERTVKNMESTDRKAYSLALLSVSQGKNIVFAPSLSFGKVSVKERISRVMNRKIPVWAICLTIIICIFLLFLTVFTFAAEEFVPNAPSDSMSDAGTESGEDVVSDEPDTSGSEDPVSDASDAGTDPHPPSDSLSEHILKLPKKLFEGGEPLALIGEWVFYVDDNDLRTNLLWGRVRLDGSDRQRYENDGIQSPIVTEDRIYYVDLNDGSHLYAMNHDGTGVTLLSEEKVCGLDEFADGRIYYHVSDDPVEKYNPEYDEYYIDWGEERYYSIKSDGTDKRQQVMGGAPEPDGWFYQFVNEYENRIICKMRPDGSEKTVLTDLPADEFTVHDGWVYFTPEMDEPGFYRVRTDGTVTEKLCDDLVNIYGMAFDETNIYYISRQNPYTYNGDGELYTIKYDGTGRKKLSDKTVNGLAYSYLYNRLLVANGTVFFQAGSSLYMVHADGTDEQLIDKNMDPLLAVDRGFFYNMNNRSFFYSFAVLQEPSQPTEGSGTQEPSAPTETLTLPDFSSMSVSDFFYEGNKYFYVGENAFWVIDSYIRGDFDRIKTRYALDETVSLPAQILQNTIADYSDYCITQVSAEPYELDGKQVEKVTIVVSLSCVKAGQEGYFDFRQEFVNTPHEHDWKLIRLDVQNGSRPQGDDTIPLTNPMSVQDFLASSKCQALQNTAFNFINAYFGGDYEGARQMFIAPSWALDSPEAWEGRSRDDYGGYGISWVSFEPYELDGEQVQGARFFLSMYRVVPGEEGVYDPLMTFVDTEDGWKLVDLDFGA